MTNVYTFDELKNAPLVIDAIYEGGEAGSISDEPISKLLPVGNSAGIRKSRSKNRNLFRFVVLFTTNDEIEWPDFLNTETGIFTYYGDNRKPGNQITETKFKGNAFFENIFCLTDSKENRIKIPPIFVFQKYPTKISQRSVKFLGLAVPGTYLESIEDSLIAIWKNYNGMRFQNYEARFTILNIPVISRDWLNQMIDEKPVTLAHKNYINYLNYGLSEKLALKSEKAKYYRTKEEQLPSTKLGLELIGFIHSSFLENPYGFEKFAKEILPMMDSNFIEVNLTQKTRDGGIDAFGKYSIHHKYESLYVNFAMEAKCYNLNNGINYSITKRLISRLKHREFGVFITSSFIVQNAMREIYEDQHPVLFITARDIVDILYLNHIDTLEKLNKFIKKIKGL